MWLEKASTGENLKICRDARDNSAHVSQNVPGSAAINISNTEIMCTPCMNNQPASVNQQGNPFRTKITIYNNRPHQLHRDCSGIKPITRDQKVSPNKTVVSVYKTINKAVNITDVITAMRKMPLNPKEAKINKYL